MKRITLTLFFISSLIFANVDVSVSPAETDGSTPVILKFTAKNADETPDILKIADDPNWKISPPFTQSQSSFRLDGLKAQSESTTTIMFYLYPLKTGQLKVPFVQIKLKDRIYNSPDTSIRVTRIAQNNKQKVPSLPRPPGFPVFPMDEEDFDVVNPGQPSNSKDLNVAIVAEPSKVEVYTGELIVLPFYIYTNEDIFRNLEFASFPTFKDFIKEELWLPKNWRTERVNYRGEQYYKAEVIRFALFPLKEGELLIDPLNMRFEIDAGLFDLRKSFGDDEGPKNNFMRSSGSVPVKVKALPPKPSHIAQKNIAVGKYNIRIFPPPAQLTQNEAFTLKVRVEGQGNIKGIPEPEIQLPEGLQKSKTSTDYSINTISEGYKDFDYLLVPRKSGDLQIAEKNWTYFDPDKKNYEEIPMPSIELKIRPSSKGNRGTGNELLTRDLVFSGEQDFVETNSKSLPIFAWVFPTLLFALAGFFFVQRKKHEKENSLLSAMPWIRIERKILAQHDLSSNEALGLVEEWILQRFRPLGVDEAAFEDLSEKLKSKVAPNAIQKIEKLREKFKLIESTRFGTKKKTNNLNLSFSEIKKLCEEIVYACETYSQPEITDEDDA